ncbi:MAG: cofactor-independent phosphoglycerate mutase [Dehalococcoidia bacterium]
MKYCVLIIDGGSGWPMADRGGRTCLELAHTPHLDAMAKSGVVGLVRNVPQGAEASSACACMSVLGYDPRVHYRGRSAVEAEGMRIPMTEGDVVFRCNLVTVRRGKMWSYSCGLISTGEARLLIDSLNGALGSDNVQFFPGVSYRHICRIKGREDALMARCTPPHDIPNKAISEFLPHGPGSDLLRDLMQGSEHVLRSHPVNIERTTTGELPASMIWLFWGSARLPAMPSFKEAHGLEAAMTSGVDVMRGLAHMIGMQVLDIPGVTGGPDNDYASQAIGALEALENHDMVITHIEATDDAAHAGRADEKIEAIEAVDREIVGRLLARNNGDLRVLVLPDHATPVEVQTHVADPVPFVLWGRGFSADSGHRARRFTEAEATGTGVFIGEGHGIMSRLVSEGWDLTIPA